MFKINISPARAYGSCLAVVWALLLVVARPAATAPLQLRYEVYGGGFNLLGFAFTIDQSESAYRIDGSFATRGLLDFVVGFTLRTATVGVITTQGPMPRQYESISRFRSKNRRTQVDFLPDGRVTAQVVPPDDNNKRIPPTPQQIIGSVDTLSAILRVARDIAAGAPCRQMVPVFDGRRRYDLVFTDRGERDLKPSSRNVYAGPTHLCHVLMRRIAGFDPDPEEKADNAMVFIAAPLPGEMPVPVRIELESSWGYVIVHLVGIRGAAGERQLTE